MKLVIVESPKKANTIRAYLGKEYEVEGSGGHIRDLPESGLGVDVENNFEPTYVVTAGKTETIAKIQSKVAKAEAVYLATDPDREGEAISWHLAEVLGLPEDAPIRIEFHEISKKAVTAALAAPRKIDLSLVDAQQARRVLDRIVGYKISPILNKKVQSARSLSAGRVQSAALRMLVDREREIRAFVPQEYWTLQAFLAKGPDTIRTNFEEINGKKHRISCKEELDTMLANMADKDFVVDSVKKTVRKSYPQPPFTTSTLQQDATIKFKMSAPEVMQIAQQLYEGMEIPGEGHVALVTYIRTDSVRVSDDALLACRHHIQSTFGADYLPKSPIHYKTSSNAQDAHEAIRPISLEMTPALLASKINDKKCIKVYELIYNRFVASQMTPAQYNTLDIRVGIQATHTDNYGFHSKGRALKFAGFTAVYNDIKKDDDEDGDISSPLNEQDILSLSRYAHEQKFTKPPQRYTESSLVKAMEENGIGRPSTYASIISVLSKRAYTAKEGNSMKATELGEQVVDEINKNFADIIDLKFTANMESELDDVAVGKRDWRHIIATFYPTFMSHVYAAYKETTPRKPAEVTDIKCDKCGAYMVIKEGRNGTFLACPNYPKCKNTKNLNNAVVGTCPSCGKSVLERTTKAGKKFYGCEGYPTCKFASWDIPAPYFCPQCGETMKQVTNKGVIRYKCTKCNHSEDKKEGKK